MLDSHLCLSARVNVRYTLHTQPLGLYNKILVLYVSIHSIPVYSPPPPFLAYLIYFSDDQHKEQQCQC
jgi:hypothetical protein